MCTTTFVPLGNAFVLTTNRDEKTSREKAILPDWETREGQELIFPKDPQAGGTWVVFNKTLNAVGIFLNGAHYPFSVIKHSVKTRSRGLVLLDLIQAEDILQYFNNCDFTYVDPFTGVFFVANQLYELRWDGNVKEHRLLPDNQCRIWSSSTLFSEAKKKEKEVWFDTFLANCGKDLSAEKIFDYHAQGAKDTGGGFLFDDETLTKTVSVSQIIMSKEHSYFHYFDCVTKERYSCQIQASFVQSVENS